MRFTRDDFWFVIREYAETLVLAVLISVVLRLFVVGSYRVSTDSMAPALLQGEFLLGYRLPYALQVPFSQQSKVGKPKPRKGDVAIFRCPDDPENRCIKRIVGFPGDVIELQRQRLIVNGDRAQYQPVTAVQAAVGQVVLEETLGTVKRHVVIGESREAEDFGPVVVPPGTLFVLNDNRSDGNDSRKWGPVPLHSLESRAWLVWMSLDWFTAAGEVRAWPRLRWPRIMRGID